MMLNLITFTKQSTRILILFLEIIIYVSKLTKLKITIFGGNDMSHINKNNPSLKNSTAVGQEEIQNVKQSINATTGQGMVAGSVPNLSSSNSVGQKEIQNVKQNMNSTTSQVNTASAVPNLNSSTSVGDQELQNAKNKVQESGNSKGLF